MFFKDIDRDDAPYCWYRDKDWETLACPPKYSLYLYRKAEIEEILPEQYIILPTEFT